MATKKSSPKKSVPKTPATKKRADTEPVFPYTNKPGSLRRFLQEIPKRPKPAKFDSSILKSWGFADTNDLSILRVLRAIGLTGASNEPTELYTRFMNLNGGASQLAAPIRDVYKPLFEASHAPYKESADSLKNLFNIHSGGSAKTLEFQMQTFKALAESTSFEASDSVSNSSSAVITGEGLKPIPSNPTGGIAVHIDLHIHLPENKSRRDYETIIEDIGRYIYGKDLNRGVE